MIFRKFINSEEISFCNVDTPEEALEILLDENATYYDEVMDKMRETIYGFQAMLGKKHDGEPGDIWEIKGYANADNDMPAEVRKVKLPFGQLRRAYPELFPVQADGKKSGKRKPTKKALLELGNRFLKLNSKARKLQREFEKQLLDHCDLEQMPSDCSDVYIDLDCYGMGSMTEKNLDTIIDQISRAAKMEKRI